MSLDPVTEAFFAGPGELARLTRAFDWETTPLGPVESWTASLRTTVSTLLASRHAMFLWWGPDLIQFYNDAYRQSLGIDRHPSALGARGRECWAEIWPIIGGEVESIMAGGESTWHEDSLVPITRGDGVHDVYWSYSYSPVRDDDGSVGGVLVTVQETTRRVVLERRARVLSDLAAEMLRADSVDAVCREAGRCLEAAVDDVAFALLYLDDANGMLRLACATGLVPGSAAAPDEIRLDSDAVWPVARALASAGTSGGAAPSAPVVPVVRGRWHEPVREALTVAIAAGTVTRAEPADPPAHGVLVIGFNPRLPIDESSRQFATQVAHEVAATLDALARVGRERDLLSGVFQLSPSFLAVLRGPEHVFELVNPAYDQLIAHRPALGRRLRDVLPRGRGAGIPSAPRPRLRHRCAVHRQRGAGAAAARRRRAAGIPLSQLRVPGDARPGRRDHRRAGHRHRRHGARRNPSRRRGVTARSPAPRGRAGYRAAAAPHRAGAGTPRRRVDRAHRRDPVCQRHVRTSLGPGRRAHDRGHLQRRLHRVSPRRAADRIGGMGRRARDPARGSRRRRSDRDRAGRRARAGRRPVDGLDQRGPDSAMPRAASAAAS